MSPRARKRDSVALSRGPESDVPLRRVRSSGSGKRGVCEGEAGMSGEVGSGSVGVEAGPASEDPNGWLRTCAVDAAGTGEDAGAVDKIWPADGAATSCCLVPSGEYDLE